MIESLRAGDQGAATALYRRLYPVVARGLARSRASSEHEDLVQTAFERIIRTLVFGQFRGTCSLSSWAFAIARNCGHDGLRGEYRRRRIFAEPPLQEEEALGESDPERVLGARAQLAKLEGVLGRIPQRLATAVLLSDGLGFDIHELAVAMGSTTAAASSRLRRGRLELRRRSGGACRAL